MTAAETAARVRDGDTCQRCGRNLYGQRASQHHRKLRSACSKTEWDLVENIVTLCGTGTTGCHGHVHHNRNEAYDTGWIVHRWDDPAMIPMTMLTGTQLIHDPFGNKIVQPPLLEGA
jgi:hypothetical protein